MDWIIVVFITLSVSLAHCNSQENVIFIAPTYQEPFISVPEGNHTLSYYVDSNQSTRLFNASNTIVNFLPGEHIVRGTTAKQFIVNGVTNVIWRGLLFNSESQTSIICEKELTFVFLDVSNLTISDIHILDCGCEYYSVFYTPTPEKGICFYPDDLTINASLVLIEARSVQISNIVISGAIGFSLFAVN